MEGVGRRAALGLRFVGDSLSEGCFGDCEAGIEWPLGEDTGD